jgi:quercetin dioxygenase-like cupin family protein
METLMKLNLTTRLGIAALALAAVTTFAQAGECPAGKMKDNAVTSGEMMPKNVTDTVLASIDLAPKGEAFKGEALRLRKLVIQPGGVVPWHDHKTRPANIYIVSGTVTEYRSSCEVPIVHKAGDTVAEFGAGFSHWWKNTGKKPAVLISADIFHNAGMDDHMM